ncbi:hypothetical protein OAX78_01080 [Planctomycetota bacterium]|nr:hypothetical protein [Planctomycetota bacterium]
MQVGWIALILGMALPAHGDGDFVTSCPVDRERSVVPAAQPWNTGGGVDSDDCRYAVEADGQRRVLGLDDVVECSRCHAAFRRDHLELTLSVAEKDAIRAAVGDDLVTSDLPGVRRLELAAATYGALTTLPENASPQAIRAVLLLQSAWAARAEAVLRGPDAGYRPQTLAQAWTLLQELDVRAAAEPGVEGGPADALLVDLERARAALGKIDGVPLAARFALEHVHLELMRAERRAMWLRDERSRTEREQANEAGALHRGDLLLAVACAWERWGDPVRRDHWLDAVEVFAGEGAAAERLQREVVRIRRSCAEERRLLGVARESLLNVADAAAGPPERARLLYLAGDAARRRGELELARADLHAAAAAFPPGEAAARAEALLEHMEGE